MTDLRYWEASWPRRDEVPGERRQRRSSDSRGRAGGAGVNQVTIVVVLYNSAAHVDAFLDSLPAATEGVPAWQLIAVDNGSTDDGPARVSTRAPEAVVVRQDNRGYAAGINVGIAAAESSQAVLVVNPDTRLGAGSVLAMLAELSDPGVGIAVPRLFTTDGRLGWSLRREPTVLRALGEAVLGGSRAGRFPALGEIICDPAMYQRSACADWASGCAMMISRACLNTVGRWDERYFMYSEETDFALRARDAGFALRLTPKAVVVHVGGEGQYSPHLHSMLTVNRVRLFAGRHGTAHTAAFWGVVTIGEALRAVFGAPVHRAALRALLRPSRWGVR
jgi:N-acetylglucosaminyl-diphospho-decaprenol L-rhamnosyltransferase